MVRCPVCGEKLSDRDVEDVEGNFIREDHLVYVSGGRALVICPLRVSLALASDAE